MSKEIYTDLENNKYIMEIDPYDSTTSSNSMGCYFQVIPNSQIFTTIEQLLEYSKHTDQYLYQGIKNSIEQSYKLIK